MKTQESHAESPRSAMASFKWLGWFATTDAEQVRTVVKPSGSASMVPPSSRSLLRNKAGFDLGSEPKGLPLLIVLIVTGSGSVPASGPSGTTAEFTLVLEPAAVTKNPNVSFTELLTNSLYSSDAKT